MHDDGVLRYSRAANDAVAKTKVLHRELDNNGSLRIDSMRYRGAWNYTFVE